MVASGSLPLSTIARSITLKMNSLQFASVRVPVLQARHGLPTLSLSQLGLKHQDSRHQSCELDATLVTFLTVETKRLTKAT